MTTTLHADLELENEQTETLTLPVGDPNSDAMKDRFERFVYDLQDRICAEIESRDPKANFEEDLWQRAEGGGGRTRVIGNGEVYEKGGVNCSTVYGPLPDAIKKNFKVDQGWFFATGISLIIHPVNPMVPTVHANFRYFELYESEGGKRKDAWFGGGADLTPYYLYPDDAVEFHKVWKDACDKHNPAFYPKFKQECDDYFRNHHRQESRGIGGIFYDYCRADENTSLEDWFAFATEVGNAFTSSYLPIVDRRMNETYSDEQRYFQEIRRGRYVEFNLIHDRGTLFGLKTNGRIESILMSLPPRVRWDYQFEVESGSRESELLEVLKTPREWL